MGGLSLATPQMGALGGFLGMQETSTYYGQLTADPILHDDTVYVAGTEQPFPIDAESGTVQFQENHDDLRGTGDYSVHNDRLIVHDDQRIGALNLETGSIGPMMRAARLVTTFGDFEAPFVLMDGGRHVLSINEESRRIERRRLF